MTSASLLAALGIALSGVRRHPLRAGLTVLGITIGIAAMVTVTALATGARENIGQQIATLGANALIVFPRSARSSGARGETTGSRLSEQDAAALVEGSTSIRAAAPFLRGMAQVANEGENVRTSILGSTLPYFEIRSWKVVEGTLWTEAQEAIGERVCVIGKVTRDQLFGASGDPVGRTLRVGRHTFRVLGVMDEKGQSPFGHSQDEVVILPISTFRSRIMPLPAGMVHAVLFSATGAETTDRAARQADEILRQRHRIGENDEPDFAVRSQSEFQKMQETIHGALTTLLLAIAAVSLVVGGIGVMNIMLVSVAERTREIGIRMAIGAREGDILAQFLVEAVVLALLGGLSGTLLGYGAIAAFRGALGWPMKLAADSLLVAVGTSSAIGVVFGFFPARRAARLDPIAALRRE